MVKECCSHISKGRIYEDVISLSNKAYRVDCLVLLELWSLCQVDARLQLLREISSVREQRAFSLNRSPDHTGGCRVGARADLRERGRVVTGKLGKCQAVTKATTCGDSTAMMQGVLPWGSRYTGVWQSLPPSQPFCVALRMVRIPARNCVHILSGVLINREAVYTHPSNFFTGVAGESSEGTHASS